MPKRNFTKVLERWIDMDAHLAGLDGKEYNDHAFAKRWRVSQRTVRRDRQTFESLGQSMDREERRPPGYQKDRIVYTYMIGRKRPMPVEFYYKYAKGVPCLFVCNQIEME